MDPEEEQEQQTEDKIRSKKVYIAMLLIAIIFSLVFKYFIAEHFVDFYSFDSCNGDGGCLENQAVYRISFGCFLFFGIMGIATYLPSTDASSIHLDWWCFKIIGYLACNGIVFLIPNGFFSYYSAVARIVSGLFLLLQIIILIDFAYDLHEYLNKDDDDQDMSSLDKKKYVGLSLIFLLTGIIGSILLYVYFPSCSINNIFITITLIFGVIITFVSITNKVDKGLLPPSVVFSYGVFLTFQALLSVPDIDCNPWAVQDDRFGIILLNLLVTISSITYVCGSTAAQAPEVLTGFCCTKKNEEYQNPPPQYWFFHWTLALASMYMAMMLTNWGLNNGTFTTSNKGWENVWIKIIPNWLTSMLFLWTLLAPVCFPGRDFSDDNNRFNRK